MAATPRIVVSLFFLSLFYAQESHVKPQNKLTHYQPTISAWHFSYTQPGILDIEIKKTAWPRGFKLLGLTHSERIL